MRKTICAGCSPRSIFRNSFCCGRRAWRSPRCVRARSLSHPNKIDVGDAESSELLRHEVSLENFANPATGFHPNPVAGSTRSGELRFCRAWRSRGRWAGRPCDRGPRATSGKPVDGSCGYCWRADSRRAPGGAHHDAGCAVGGESATAARSVRPRGSKLVDGSSVSCGCWGAAPVSLKWHHRQHGTMRSFSSMVPPATIAQRLNRQAGMVEAVIESC